MSTAAVLHTELEDAIRAKLDTALKPLSLAELAKGKPRKTSAVEYQNQIRAILEAQIRSGQAFCYSSGKKGAERYWSKDEKHLLRTRALDFAVTPQTLAQLTKGLTGEVKAEKSFVEAVVRELDGDGQLFEYPPLKKDGPPRFCTKPPPPPVPPLEQPKNKKSLDRLVRTARDLIETRHVHVDELIRVLRDRLVNEAPRSESPNREPPIKSPDVQTDRVQASSMSEIETIILKEVEHSAAVSIADLRESLPTELRGTDFDEAILRLADAERISVHEDVEAGALSDAERSSFVKDGSHLYTAISKKG